MEFVNKVHTDTHTHTYTYIATYKYSNTLLFSEYAPVHLCT